MKRAIPNTLTLTNLFCGCLAIVMILRGELAFVPLIIIIGAIADFGDGMAARLLKVQSEKGKQLDSLADMVSFGVAPSMMMFYMLENSLANPTIYNCAPAFLIALFSCLRLAKFNLDERQTEDFIGLATPASTVFILGLFLVFQDVNCVSSCANEWVICLIKKPIFLYITTVVVSLLLISELPMFSLKLKSFKWQKNEFRYIFLISSIILLILLKTIAIPLVIVLYIILSIIKKLLNK